MRDFHTDFAWSKKFVHIWDDFWKEKYPTCNINRDVPVELDKLGVDVIITHERGRRILVDEKVTCDIYPDYPIEIVKNTELKKDGWGWANRGATIAIGKHPKDTVYFSEPPVVFEINDKFTKRILENPRYETRMLGTKIGNGYHTLIKRVPREDLVFFNDDAKWKEKYGENHKLWEF